METSMKHLVLLLLFPLFFACAHKLTKSEALKKVEENVEILPELKGAKYSNIYFSGQPPLKNMAELKLKGFSTVINLRQEKENVYFASEEEKAVKEAGLSYVHAPMKGSEPLSDTKLKEITEAVVAHRKEGKILVHCSSGNRAALWAGGHFFSDHGSSKEEAFEIAKRLGLTNRSLQKNLKNYLENK